MNHKYRLSAEQRAIVEHDLASPSARIQRRAQAMKRLHEGQTVTAVAKELAVSRQAVYNWIVHYGFEAQNRQADRDLIGAVIDALQEREWCLDDLQAALEQRLGRPVEPRDLRIICIGVTTNGW